MPERAADSIDSLESRGVETQRHEVPARQKKFWYAAAVLLALWAAAQFALEFRSPVLPTNDLTVPWVSAKALAAGKNPYTDMPTFVAIYAATGIGPAYHCQDYPCIFKAYTLGYPPSALALMTPLGLLPWRVAVEVMLLVSAGLFVAALVLLVRKLRASLRVEWSDPRVVCFVAFTLALAPLHAGIHNSNPNTIVLACIMAAFVWTAKHPRAAGVALAIALCVKPQIAVLFFGYLCLRGRWKVAASACVGCAVICAVPMLWLYVHHVAWVQSYRHTLASFAGPGQPSSFDVPGLGRYYMLNLQVLVYQLTLNRAATVVVSNVVFAVLAVVAVVLIRLRVSDRNESAGVALAATLTLLPVYGRYYSAAVLLFVLYWAFENWQYPSARTAVVMMFGFLMSMLTILRVPRVLALFDAHHLGTNRLWNATVMPYAVWLELGLVGLLFLHLARQPAKA